MRPHIVVFDVPASQLQRQTHPRWCVVDSEKRRLLRASTACENPSIRRTFEILALPASGRGFATQDDPPMEAHVFRKFQQGCRPGSSRSLLEWLRWDENGSPSPGMPVDQQTESPPWRRRSWLGLIKSKLSPGRSDTVEANACLRFWQVEEDSPPSSEGMIVNFLRWRNKDKIPQEFFDFDKCLY